MKNSKYIKVSVSERMPEKEGRYACLMRTTFKMYPNMPFNPDNEDSVTYWKNEVNYWLEEKPDYEDEMKEMLEKVYETLGQIWQIDDKNKIFEFIDPVEIEELLTKLKTES